MRLGRSIRVAAASLLAGIVFVATAAAQTYTVGIATPPFGFADEATGEARGYSVDVMNAIAEDSGLEVAFRVFEDPEALLPALVDGTVDVVAGPITMSAKRVDMGIAFSSVYARWTEALVVPKSDTKLYLSVTNIGGEVVGASQGSAYLTYLLDKQENATFFEDVVDTTEATGLDGLAGDVEALRTGAVKAIFTDSYSLPYAQAHGQFTDVKAVRTYAPVLRSAAAIAVRADDTALLGAIQASLSKLIVKRTIGGIARTWSVNAP